MGANQRHHQCRRASTSDKRDHQFYLQRASSVASQQSMAILSSRKKSQSGGDRGMANHMFEAGSGSRIPFRGRLNSMDRALRTSEFRQTNRVIDPKLIQQVRRANGRAKRIFDFASAAAALVF